MLTICSDYLKPSRLWKHQQQLMMRWRCRDQEASQSSSIVYKLLALSSPISFHTVDLRPSWWCTGRKSRPYRRTKSCSWRAIVVDAFTM